MTDKALETFSARRKRLWAEAEAAYDRWFVVPHADTSKADSWRAGYVSALMDRATADNGSSAHE
jgi:hypothetical protein